MKVFVSGGGTGGHFFPALALIECLSERGIEAVYTGSERGIEARLKEHIRTRSVFVSSHPFMGKSLKEKLYAVWKNLFSGLKLSGHVRREDRGIVFGGYASLPLGIACLLKRAPLYLHEQNSIPSKTNRLLSRFSRRVFITFEYSRKYFPEYKAVKTGLPVRRALLEGLKIDRNTALERLGLEDRITLLVVGGSQGAVFLNQMAVEIFSKTGWQGIHITGEKDYQRLRELYEAKGLKVLALPFSHQMELLYRASTLALSRAGASTITELSLYGIPALFVPYPYAVEDHQFYNAKEIEEMGGGLLIRQEEASLEKVLSLLERLLSDYEKYSRNIRAFANPLACDQMLEYILN